jgi:hypothetical protein
MSTSPKHPADEDIIQPPSSKIHKPEQAYPKYSELDKHIETIAVKKGWNVTATEVYARLDLCKLTYKSGKTYVNNKVIQKFPVNWKNKNSILLLGPVGPAGEFCKMGIEGNIDDDNGAEDKISPKGDINLAKYVCSITDEQYLLNSPNTAAVEFRDGVAEALRKKLTDFIATCPDMCSDKKKDFNTNKSEIAAKKLREKEIDEMTKIGGPGQRIPIEREITDEDKEELKKLAWKQAFMDTYGRTLWKQKEDTDPKALHFADKVLRYVTEAEMRAEEARVAAGGKPYEGSTPKYTEAFHAPVNPPKDIERKKGAKPTASDYYRAQTRDANGKIKAYRMQHFIKFFKLTPDQDVEEFSGTNFDPDGIYAPLMVLTPYEDAKGKYGWSKHLYGLIYCSSKFPDHEVVTYKEEFTQ